MQTAPRRQPVHNPLFWQEPCARAASSHAQQLLPSSSSSVRFQSLPALARFVTPPSYPRRFDTVFFVAVANEGCNAAEAWVQQQQQQQQQQRGPEIVGAKWMGAREALASKLQLMPPQWLLLQQLAQHATIADVLNSCSHDLPQHRTIMPVVLKEQREDGVKTYVLPGDVDHPVFPGQAGALSRFVWWRW
jgi:hypothetical protein